ncbi:endothelin-converting enzyme homolog [Paramacrobiotus metropolitanus]|uniref:endothelin-converting enzyme homolog n=1 Tax=Paramacrobiotus metropolitanus TaxID=2943436 RepID=UPI0024464A29|nr:endothelin-converting enzyme homolog [Paramacrobiotus metropolitanus]
MMVNDIRAGFKELLDEANWMDKATYDGAVKKLAAIQEIIAYPDIMLSNTSAIDSYFTTITIQPTFLRSILQSQRSNTIRKLQSITRPRFVVMRWRTPLISLPLTRFDTIGAKYDPEGVHRQWWTNTTINEYERRAKSLVQQYNNYSMPTGKVNGQLTLGENIADNGGLRAALKEAYRSHVPIMCRIFRLVLAVQGYTRYLARPDTKEPVPPGLENYTALQLFFISAAQLWCTKTTPDQERLDLLADTHAPNKWRVNGPMSNMREFSQSFNCPLGSKMNPETKNRVW